MATSYQKARFTEAFIRNAKPVLDEDGNFVAPRRYKSADTKGLLLIVGAHTKSFFVRGVVGGVDVRRLLGEHGDITLTEAVHLAEDTRVKFRAGVDPLLEAKATAEQQRAEAAAGVTLQQAWELAKSRMAKKGRSSRTVDSYADALKLYFPAWLDRSLITITRTDVETRHEAIRKEVVRGKHAVNAPRTGKRAGMAAANAAMRVFRVCWNVAAILHPELPTCPTVAVSWFPPAPKRKVQLDNLAAWWTATGALGNPIRRDYLRLMLFTGLRRTSAATIRVEHVDEANQVVHIPAPKGGELRAFDLPLTTWLAATIKERRRENKILYSRSPWLFPADSASGHIVEAREGDVFKPHDLRRLFASAAAACKVEPYTLKALLNQKGDVTAGYVSVGMEDRRKAMEAIGARLMELCTAENIPSGYKTPKAKKTNPKGRKNVAKNRKKELTTA